MLVAQQGSTPGLHTRAPGNSETPDATGKTSPSEEESTLPRDVSGSYDFDRLNESIEIDLDGTKLSGYISRLGDDETDKTTPLTFFFDKTSVDGSRIEFQTRVLHGLWYSFRGTIVRGEAETRADHGYYVLHGVLEEHHPQSRDDKSADETIEKRTVNFKSMPQ